jgi:hypothetical protein
MEPTAMSKGIPYPDWSCGVVGILRSDTFHLFSLRCFFVQQLVRYM